MHILPKLFLFLFILLAIVSLSKFYPTIINSDDAIPVLVATNKGILANDIYFWGQNRFGMGHFLLLRLFVKYLDFGAVFNIKYTIPISCTAIFLLPLAFFYSHRYFLLSGILAIISTKMFYSHYQIFEIGQPYMLQMGLLLGLLYCFIINSTDKFSWKKWFGIGFLSCWLVWLSQTTLIFMFTWIVIILCTEIFNKERKIASVFLNSLWLPFSFIFYKWIQYYSLAQKISGFRTKTELLPLSETINSLGIFCSEMSFNELPFWISITLYISLVFVGLHLVSLFCKKSKLYYFFERKIEVCPPLLLPTLFLSCLMYFYTISSLLWIKMNTYNNRYLIPIYICWMFISLTYLYSFINSKIWKRTIICLFLCIYFVNFYSRYQRINNSEKPKVQKMMEELTNLYENKEKIGIIANSRNSYKYAAYAPKNIIATPHEHDALRNIYLPREIAKLDKIYFCFNGWDANHDISPPKMIRQFGYLFTFKQKVFIVEEKRFYLYASVVRHKSLAI